MKIFYHLAIEENSKNIYISINEEKRNLAIYLKMPLRINRDDWDEVRGRPKNIYMKRYKKLNELLNEIKIKLFEFFNRKERIIYAAREASKIIKNCVATKNIPQNPNEGDLVYFMQDYIATHKALIKKNTYKRYRVFLKLVKLYEGQACKRLRIEDVDSKFTNEFVVFCREESYSESTICRSLNFVKTILNYIEKKGIKTHVKEIETRKDKNQQNIVTLTEREITQIKKTFLPEELQTARDWLLISCYTGQRFSDFMQFTEDNIIEIGGKVCLNFIQQKTQKEILLPLHPEVSKVISRNEGAFPKCLDIKNYNENIKEIAKLAKLENKIKYRKRIKFRSEDQQVEKWEAISSHIGRRSFATNFYGKIPTALLMEATGHSTESMFKRYVNTHDKTNMYKLANYFEKFENKDESL